MVLRADKLLATAALLGVVVANGALVLRLCNYLSLDAAMATASASGIGSAIAGAAYFALRLAAVEKHFSSHKLS